MNMAKIRDILTPTVASNIFLMLEKARVYVGGIVTNFPLLSYERVKADYFFKRMS